MQDLCRSNCRRHPAHYPEVHGVGGVVAPELATRWGRENNPPMHKTGAGAWDTPAASSDFGRTGLIAPKIGISFYYNIICLFLIIFSEPYAFLIYFSTKQYFYNIFMFKLILKNQKVFFFNPVPLFFQLEREKMKNLNYTILRQK